MFCHHQKGRDCWPKVTITRFYDFDDNKIYGYLVLTKFKSLSIFQGFKDSKSFLPLKEGVEDSRIFKYGIKLKIT